MLIGEAPPAQHGDFSGSTGEPSNGGEAVTMGFVRGLAAGAERHDTASTSGG
jgi:hypothetical protein